MVRQLESIDVAAQTRDEANDLPGPPDRATEDSMTHAMPWDQMQLLQRCLGNRELARRVVVKFEEGFTAELGQIRQAAYEGDVAMVAQVAHRLKGGAANLSAEGIRQIAERLENCGRAGQLNELPAMIDGLQQEWLRLMQCTASFVRE